MENTKDQDYIESSQQQWDEEYRSNMWDYLSDISEYARYAIVYGYIRKFVAKQGILDMGCGTGILYDMLTDSEKKNYTGVDISKEAIMLASSKTTEAVFHCGDINQYVPSRKYDVIIFNESLQYVPNAPSKLDEYSLHLTPDGVIITSLYSHKNTLDPDYAMVENKTKEIEQCGLFDVVDKVSLLNHNSGLKWYIHLLKKKS